jgi:polar amino acid transport system substrate-binding protein
MRKLSIVVFCLISSLAFADDSKVLTFAADPWCPWNCDGVKENGIGVDIAKAIYEPLGYKVEYVIMPWNRAINMAKEGKIHALIGADSATDLTRNFIFPKTPLSHSNNAYAIKDDSNFIYNGPESVKNKVIGIVADYHFKDSLGDYIDKNYQDPKIVAQVFGEKGASINLHKLVNNRIDLYVDDKYVIEYVARQEGLSNKIKIGGTLKEEMSGNYIAFSPVISNSSELARLYDQGVEKLISNGSYKKILSKYGISDN